MKTRSTTSPTSRLFAFALLALTIMVPAQMRSQAGTESHAHTKSAPSLNLKITGPDGKLVTISPVDLKAMAHKSVTLTNGHTQASAIYTGVPLSVILALAGTPVGKDLKGKAYVMYVLAEGTDHYRVLYSLDEIDGAAHTGDILVADTIDGKALADDGAFKLVSSEDKRPARWVRNLASLTVKSAD